MLKNENDMKKKNIKKLKLFAKQHNLRLSISCKDFHLKGIIASDKQLTDLINKSRKSGIISMEKVHNTLFNNH